MKELLDFTIPENISLASLTLTENSVSSCKHIKIKGEDSTSITPLTSNKINTNLYTSFSNNDEIVDNSSSLLPTDISHTVNSNIDNSTFYLSPNSDR
jgi:hypothetical protein